MMTLKKMDDPTIISKTGQSEGPTSLYRKSSSHVGGQKTCPTEKVSMDERTSVLGGTLG